MEFEYVKYEYFNKKYELLLQYIEDVKLNNEVIENKLKEIKPKDSKLTKMLVFYNIGSIIVNIIILIKLFL